MTIKDQVIADISLEVGEAVTPSTQLTEVLDSLEVVHLVSHFEDQFDIQVEDKEIDGLKTVADVQELIEKHVNQTSAGTPVQAKDV